MVKHKCPLSLVTSYLKITKSTYEMHKVIQDTNFPNAKIS